MEMKLSSVSALSNQSVRSVVSDGAVLCLLRRKERDRVVHSVRPHHIYLSLLIVFVVVTVLLTTTCDECHH